MSPRPTQRPANVKGTLVPSYKAFQPASSRASAAARGASRKKDTRCEIALRRELWRLGLRYRVAFVALPGKPDIVFIRERVVIFCDGDFWHGRDLDARLQKLRSGHNAPYWVQKIRRNVQRDAERDETLRALGWTVLRYWETDLLRDAASAAVAVHDTVRRRKR